MFRQTFQQIFHKKKPLHLKVAFIISRLSDPVTWFLPLGILIIYYSQPSGEQNWFWLVGFVVFLALLPMAMILSKLKKKKISDIDLTKKEERTPVYITLIILWALALILAELLDGPKLILATLLAAEIICILILFINLKWKVSNHSLVMMIASIFFVVIISPKLWWFFLSVPIVGWSRVVQKKHTPAQIIVGAALGMIFFIVLKGFGY